MAFIVWNDKMTVGIAEIDNDHKKMVLMINKLFDGISEGKGKEVLTEMLEHLVEYTSVHFAREEKLFAATHYPAAAAHKKEHDEMIAWAADVQTRFNKGALVAPTLDVMVYLKDWLFDHILGSDMEYVSHFKAMGIE